MDSIYRGLAGAQNAYALGRPDMAPGDRPGAMLVGLVAEALAAGRFDRRRPSPSPVVASVREMPAAFQQREDFGAFEDGPDEIGLGH